MMRNITGIVCLFLICGFQLKSQPSARPDLSGTWKSYNRPDTLTLRVTNDSTLYFETAASRSVSATTWSYFVYRNDEQWMMELTPAGSSQRMLLILWQEDHDHLRLQGVDQADFDNPLARLPAETNKNTFRLRRVH